MQGPLIQISYSLKASLQADPPPIAYYYSTDPLLRVAAPPPIHVHATPQSESANCHLIRPLSIHPQILTGYYPNIYSKYNLSFLCMELALQGALVAKL